MTGEMVGAGHPRPPARLGLTLVVLASVLLASSPAHACSCTETDLERWLPEAEGAFVGTYVDRHFLSDQEAMITFQVERVVKGEFGPTAIVRTNADGASCGLEFLDGPRTGLLLDRVADGVWESSLCQQVSPDELLALAPKSAPPDPDVEAIDPGPAIPWWAFALIGAVGVGAILALASRSRRSPA